LFAVEIYSQVLGSFQELFICNMIIIFKADQLAYIGKELIASANSPVTIGISIDGKVTGYKATVFTAVHKKLAWFLASSSIFSARKFNLSGHYQDFNPYQLSLTIN